MIARPLRRLRRHLTSDEDGAILPIIGILIVVLLVFAAFTVDLGAAWGERRQDQTAADAAVMAAGLQYLSNDDAPSSDETISIVMDYASRNLTDPPTTAEWQACVDNDKPDANYNPLSDGVGNVYDCISLRQESDAPTRLRVRIPDRSVPTAFATIIGIDTIDVSAAAIVQLQYEEKKKILPFSLPLDPNMEECLGVPPNGHNDGDVAPCADGSDSGNFGLLDSPWYGSGPPHNTGDVCNDGQGSIEPRSEMNIALGLDHIVIQWPYEDDPAWVPGQEYKPPNGAPLGVGYDNCDTADSGDDPFIMKTETGGEYGNADIFSDGMIGDGPYGVGDPLADPPTGPQPGKLQQIGGFNDGDPDDRLSFSGAGLDNVGLWEYITHGNPAFCNFGSTGPGNIGQDKTEQLLDCIDHGNPTFSLDILESPRFAIVPVLNYQKGTQTGLGWYAITSLRPVYIQSTWYDCTNNGLACLFHPDDFINPDLDGSLPQDATWDDTIPEWYSPVFNPGEGTTVPCYTQKGYDDDKPEQFDCKTPSKITLAGSSGVVLEWDWIPGAENAIGSSAPYLVELYR